MFNVDLKLVLSDASEIPLMYNVEPPYRTKHIAILPNKIDVDGPVKAVISFRYEYLTKGDVSFAAMEYDNYDSLRDSGIDFCFGDGDLSVQSGTAHASFRDDGISSWIAD